MTTALHLSDPTRNDPSPAAPSTPTKANAEEAFAKVAKVARTASRGRSLRSAGDFTDVVQEAVLIHLESLRSQGEDAAAFGANGDIGNPGLLREQARAAWQEVRWGGTGVRSEDLRAYSIFIDESRDHSRRLGRGLTHPEAADLAEEIRLRWPPSRRPHERFHEQVAAVANPLELAFEQPESSSLPDGATAWADLPDCRAVLAIEAEAIGEHRRQEFEVNAANAWNLLAEARPGIPVVIAGTISRPRKKKLAEIVRDSGVPVAELAERGLDKPESCDIPAQRALLVPYFGMREPERRSTERILEVLAEHQKYSHRLWESALSLAARRREA